MKSKDSVFYLVSILTLALLVLTPVIVESIFAQDAPITNVLNTWLIYGENFVNSLVFAAGY